MEKTQTKMVNSKKELREFVDFLMDCWNNQLYLAPETEEKLEHGIKSLLIPASEEGDEDAIHCMAILYDSGKWNIQLDEEKALSFARLLADKGRADWQVIMGFFYSEGGPVKRSPEKAFEWFMKAAEQGDVWGQYLVADCYESGNGVKQSNKKAFEWYKKAAEQGDEDAMYMLGWYYCLGRGVKRDDEEGYKWFEKTGHHSIVEVLRKGERNRDGDGEDFEPYPGDISDDDPLAVD